MGVVVVGGGCEVIVESACDLPLKGEQLFAAKDIKRDGRKLALLDLGGQDEAANHQTLKFTHLHPPAPTEEEVHQVARQHAGLPQQALLRALRHQEAA